MLTQARKGNPQAIAVILNHFTRPKEITTTVNKAGNALHIVFSAHRLPNQDVMTNFVQRSIEQLEIHTVDRVYITGQRVGHDPAEWHTDLSLPAIEATEDTVELIQEVKYSAVKPQTSDRTAENGLTAGTLAIATSTAIVSKPASALATAQNGHHSQDGARAPSSAITLSDSAPPTSTNQALQDLADSPIMRKPEVVVLLLFVVVLVLWQTYLAIIERAAPEGSLNGRELARRLAVSYSTISRRKHRDDFMQWSQALDPDGITWVYTEGVFVPQL